MIMIMITLGLAALIIMGKENLCDIDVLLSWAANKQMRLEGGFQVIFLSVKYIIFESKGFGLVV